MSGAYGSTDLRFHNLTTLLPQHHTKSTKYLSVYRAGYRDVNEATCVNVVLYGLAFEIHLGPDSIWFSDYSSKYVCGEIMLYLLTTEAITSVIWVCWSNFIVHACTRLFTRCENRVIAAWHRYNAIWFAIGAAYTYVELNYGLFTNNDWASVIF